MFDEDGKPAMVATLPPPYEPTSERCPGCAEIGRLQGFERQQAKDAPELLEGRRYGLVRTRGE